MKILAILPTFRNKNTYNYRVNIGFINKLKPLCDYVSVKGYSETELLCNPRELYDKHKPDVMMCMAHSERLEKFFKGLPCLKVIIAVDAWKMIRKNRLSFYTDNEFDLIVHRGHMREDLGRPSVWLPWCTDPEEFYPQNFDDKKARIGFAGTVSGIHTIRSNAIKLLGSLLDNHGRVTEGYPELLRSYYCMLSSAEHGSAHAKHFEIMASGSIVLTNPFRGEEVLFGDDPPYVTYNTSGCDIVYKATGIIYDKDKTEEMSIRARKLILKYHTSDYRIHELHSHLQNMLGGKRIERYWE